MAAGKPFNPIIGETFQCKVGNTYCYTEQTSHHPPITNYYFKGPEGVSHGWFQMEASFSGNQITMDFKGKNIMEGSDGSRYQIFLPGVTVIGIMFGRRYVNFSGSFKVIDLNNNLVSFVRFNPDERGFFGKMFSKDQYPDYFA